MDKQNHIIWTNNLNLDDWKDDLLAEDPNLSEDELYERMYSLNDDYLGDERVNLSGIVLKAPIIIIATLGLWDGSHPAAKLIDSGKVSDCLSTQEDGTVSWYVDEEGEFRASIGHHDGTNHYHYRGVRLGVDEEQLEQMMSDIICGKDVTDQLAKLTYRLGDVIGDVYGWTFPNRESDITAQ